MTMVKQITAIHAQKRNSNRVNIELDGEYAFGLSRMVAAWLKVGDDLSEERIQTLISSDISEIAYQNAIRLLDYRPRTAKEINQRLIQKGFSVEEVDRVIERLEKANLIHDQEYARMWVENRNEFHPRSQRLMRYELKNKGVDDNLIETALAESAEDNILAVKAAAKYARKLDLHDRMVFRKRLSGFLERRGFSYHTIVTVVDETIRSMELDQSTILDNEDVDNGKT